MVTGWWLWRRNDQPCTPVSGGTPAPTQSTRGVTLGQWEVVHVQADWVEKGALSVYCVCQNLRKSKHTIASGLNIMFRKQVKNIGLWFMQSRGRRLPLYPGRAPASWAGTRDQPILHASLQTVGASGCCSRREGSPGLWRRLGSQMCPSSCPAHFARRSLFTKYILSVLEMDSQ